MDTVDIAAQGVGPAPATAQPLTVAPTAGIVPMSAPHRGTTPVGAPPTGTARVGGPGMGTAPPPGQPVRPLSGPPMSGSPMSGSPLSGSPLSGPPVSGHPGTGDRAAAQPIGALTTGVLPVAAALRAPALVAPAAAVAQHDPGATGGGTVAWLPARRATVVGPIGRIDLTLPAGSPLAELVPQLVRLVGSRGGQPLPAGGWALSRLGGPPLPGSVTVAGAAIHDGEVLYLNPAGTPPAELVYDDVVDAIAGATESRTGSWQAPASRIAGTVVAGLLLAVIPLALLLSALPRSQVAVGAGALAFLLLVAGTAVARAYGDSTVGATLAAAGLPAALVAGLAAATRTAATAGPTATGGTAPDHGASGSLGGIGSLVGSGPLVGPASLAVGLVAVAVCAALAAVLVADRAAWFIPAAVVAGIGGLTATVPAAFGVATTGAAAVMVALAIAASPIMPAVALRIGRLPLPTR
jgi:hypothetical protein